jgi:hypothetical protein
LGGISYFIGGGGVAVVAIVVGGVIGVVLHIRQEPNEKSSDILKLPSLAPLSATTPETSQELSNGPDFSLEWMTRKEWPHLDLVRIRNVGNASAFNIGLRFSWEELSFSPPFDKNVLHANEEITQEAHFSEKKAPRNINIGRMDEILRLAYLSDRTPQLQVIASFSDGRLKFEKPFTFELGPGGENAERIRITPGLRERN